MTGCHQTPGTASQLYMELTGVEAKTDKIAIGDNWQKFQKSDASFDDYIIECDENLGEVQLVTLGNNGCRSKSSIAGWYADFTFVVNLQTKVGQIFPCYHWIGDGDSFTESANCGEFVRVEAKL